VEADARSPRQHGVEVGVVEHDVRGLAAQLEEEPLEERRALLHHAPAGGGRAGEGDHVDAGVDDQLLRDGVVGRRHDLQHARREVGFLGDQPAEVRGVERRVGSGLEDHRVAGGERRTDLRDGDLEGVVPRDDRGDDADGLLDDGAPAVAAERGAVGQLALPRELVDLRGGPLQLLADRYVELRPVGGHHRAPDLGDQLLAEQLGVVLDRLGELGEAALAQLLVRRPVGLVEGSARGGDGPSHVLDGGVGDLADDLLRGGVDVVEALARRGLDELAVDEHAGLARHHEGGRGLDRGHGVSLSMVVRARR
jgi:hypothetical protein